MDWEAVKQFVVSNWKEITSVILFVTATVIGIVSKKKRGLTFIEIVSGLMANELPEMIRLSEKVGGTPEQKKVQALNSALSYVSKKLGRQLSEQETSLLITKASEMIENILNTPQSHNETKPETKKTKYR